MSQARPRVPILQGERVLLRPPQPSDQEARRRLGISPVIQRGYGVELSDWTEMPEEQAARVFHEMLADDYGWVVEVNGSFAGYIGLHHLDAHDRRAALRIGLADERLLGQGIGTEAVRLVVRFAFERIGLHRLSLRVLATNQRAIRCYEKCGFRHEGRERQVARVGDGWVDDLIMGLLPDDLAGPDLDSTQV